MASAFSKQKINRGEEKISECIVCARLRIVLWCVCLCCFALFILLPLLGHAYLSLAAPFDPSRLTPLCSQGGSPSFTLQIISSPHSGKCSLPPPHSSRPPNVEVICQSEFISEAFIFDLLMSWRDSNLARYLESSQLVAVVIYILQTEFPQLGTYKEFSH